MRFDAGYLTKPFALSILFHLLVVAVTLIGWPFLAPPPPTAQPLVIVDMVKTVPKTNLAAEESQAKASSEPEQEATRRKPPPPPPPPPPAPPPPQPQQVAKAEPAPAAKPKPVVQKAEILPDKPKAVPKPTPKPVAAPKPKPKPKAEAKPKTVSIQTPVSRPQRPKQQPPKQVAQPVTRPNDLARKSQQKQKAEALNGVLQNLAEASLAKEDKKTKKATAKQDKTALAQSLTSAIGKAVKAPQTKAVAPLGLSELDRLRKHISDCWQPPIGAKGADQLKVDIQVKLEKDGTVRQAEIADRARYSSDVLYRAAANAARRAVLDCQPLPLPPEKYQLWKEFIFGFDPKFM